MNRIHANALVADRDRDFRNPDTLSRRVARLAVKAPATLAWPAARWTVNIAAVAGAALLIWSGVIHLQLWGDGYRDISVIGPLFLVQGVGSIVIAAALAVFRRSRSSRRCADVGRNGGLPLLSVYVGLFGYQESLAVPYAKSSLVIEFTGAAVLGTRRGAPHAGAHTRSRGLSSAP